MTIKKLDLNTLEGWLWEAACKIRDRIFFDYSIFKIHKKKERKLFYMNYCICNIPIIVKCLS